VQLGAGGFDEGLFNASMYSAMMRRRSSVAMCDSFS